MQGWRSFYIELHNEKAAIAAAVVQFVEECSSSESLEVGEYQKAMQNLNQLQFGYQDVEMFLFKPKLTVLVNLLGLHYCLNWLRVPVYTFITLSAINFPSECTFPTCLFFDEFALRPPLATVMTLGI